MTAIELRNVTKSYGNRSILENISLVIKRRQFVSLIGPSGVWKINIIKYDWFIGNF